MKTTRIHSMFIAAVTIVAALMMQANIADAGDKGMLRIVTEPGDAQIFINGKRKGNSPSEKGQSFAIQLEEGEYRVQAILPNGLKEGFAEKQIFIADDTLQTLTLKLEERISLTAKQAQLDYRPAPEMVALPAGHFRMGCLAGDSGCSNDEKPVLEVNVPAFSLGKFEVTFEMWDACYAQGGCDQYPDDEGWGRGTRPVINVSWNDIQKFLAWINNKTGENYRLPTEAEWEYAARAGTTTVYSWGNKVGGNLANCAGCGSQWDNKKTAPIGSFTANPWGLHDMHGNVWEWTNSCYTENYSSSSSDARAWNAKGSCERRVLRGGSWYGSPRFMRAANRFNNSPDNRSNFLGFLLARTN